MSGYNVTTMNKISTSTDIVSVSTSSGIVFAKNGSIHMLNDVTATKCDKITNKEFIGMRQIAHIDDRYILCIANKIFIYDTHDRFIRKIHVNRFRFAYILPHKGIIGYVGDDNRNLVVIDWVTGRHLGTYRHKSMIYDLSGRYSNFVVNKTSFVDEKFTVSKHIPIHNTHIIITSNRKMFKVINSNVVIGYISGKPIYRFDLTKTYIKEISDNGNGGIYLVADDGIYDITI